MFMMSKINPLMNKRVLFWKGVYTAFSIFIKNSRNPIPKYEHIIAPHVLSTSIFTRIVPTDSLTLVKIDVLDTYGFVLWNHTSSTF